jgi:hypothetical protein
LVVVEPKPPATKLFFEDPILFAKIVEGELLLLIHPSSNGDQQEPEWVENDRGYRGFCKSSFRTIRDWEISLPSIPSTSYWYDPSFEP